MIAPIILFTVEKRRYVFSESVKGSVDTTVNIHALTVYIHSLFGNVAWKKTFAYKHPL